MSKKENQVTDKKKKRKYMRRLAGWCILLPAIALALFFVIVQIGFPSDAARLTGIRLTAEEMAPQGVMGFLLSPYGVAVIAAGLLALLVIVLMIKAGLKKPEVQREAPEVPLDVYVEVLKRMKPPVYTAISVPGAIPGAISVPGPAGMDSIPKTVPEIKVRRNYTEAKLQRYQKDKPAPSVRLVTDYQIMDMYDDTMGLVH